MVDGSAGSARIARLAARLTSFFDRSAGGLSGQEGIAAGTVRTFALVSIVSTALFAVRYAGGAAKPLGVVPWLHLALIIMFAATLWLVARGRQRAAATLYLASATAGMVAMTVVFGWASGHQLYLIAAAQLVFLMFTDTQRVWRLMFATGAAIAFLAAQLGTPAVGPYAVPETVAGVFAANAVGTATLMFLLSVVAHHRAGAAQARATELAARAEYLANTDPLTGLANRRPVTARLEELARRRGQVYAVAIADLDRFKDLNDAYGHGCGDRVLAGLGTRLRGEVRVTDTLGRWGGEEFIAVLADTSLEDAVVMVERMRAAVGSSPVECGDHAHAVTVSIGVASGVGDGASHHVVRRADDALYDAKQAGRNCVRTRLAPDARAESSAQGASTTEVP